MPVLLCAVCMVLATPVDPVPQPSVRSVNTAAAIVSQTKDFSGPSKAIFLRKHAQAVPGHQYT